MHFQALQKLRLCLTMAYSKIVLRSTDARPGKWEPEAYTDGMRDWRKSDGNWLFGKLQEECEELEEAISLEKDPVEVLKEAGDVANIAMFIADKYGAFNVGLEAHAPRVVCLCGSTKFKEAFEKANFHETMACNIVLSVGAFMHADKVVYRDEEKEMLDDLHKRKIDLADEILVINVDGYVGSSTRSEILYARRTGKAIRYLHPDKIPAECR